jgi:hypothetical protein
LISGRPAAEAAWAVHQHGDKEKRSANQHGFWAAWGVIRSPPVKALWTCKQLSDCKYCLWVATTCYTWWISDGESLPVEGIKCPRIRLTRTTTISGDRPFQPFDFSLPVLFPGFESIPVSRPPSLTAINMDKGETCDVNPKNNRIIG